jgi:hypothetical protein
MTSFAIESGMITELDFFKQITSNNIKLSKEEGIDKKERVKEEFRKVCKVWSAFSKFMRN